MTSRERIFDYLSASAIVVAFGCLFVGRMLLYPVSIAPGDFLARLAAESEYWDWGHRVLLAGAVAAIPAVLGLRRAFQARSPWLSDIAAAIAILGATLAVGQFALDFAMLAAARADSPQAAQQVVDNVQNDPFVRRAFYRLPDVGQYGMILFMVALWREGRGWRVPAALVTLALAIAVVGPTLYGSAGIRAGLGVAFIGFSAVAWKIAAGPSKPVQPIESL